MADAIAKVLLFLVILVGLLALLAMGFDAGECEQRGGVLVKGFTGFYECVQRK